MSSGGLKFGILRDRKKSTHKSPRFSSTIYKPTEDQLKQLQDKLGYFFQDLQLLEHALTHRSAQRASTPKSYSSTKTDFDYERFEFLGDAVLDLVVAHMLIDAHPHVNEGELSKMRAALVNTKSLADVALELGLDHCLILSAAERSGQGNKRPSLLADVLEAVVGAIYYESSFDCAYSIVKSLFVARVDTVDPSDPKTELQELLHVLGCGEPEYQLEYREGPEHAPSFVSVVRVGNEILGRGKGATKKASQQEAASFALQRLSGFDEIDALFFKGQ